MFSSWNEESDEENDEGRSANLCTNVTNRFDTPLK